MNWFSRFAPSPPPPAPAISVNRIPEDYLRTMPWVDAINSWDGFAREFGLETLIKHPEARAIPYILIRLNDWVPEVRERAQAAVDAHLQREMLEGWIAAVPELRKLSRYGRAPHAASVAKVRDYFLAHDLTLWLADRLPLLSSEVAGFLFEMVVTSALDLPELLIQSGLESPRRYVVQLAFKRIEDDSTRRERAILTLARSVNPAIRCEAIRLSMTHQISTREEMVCEALSDKSSSVRAVAAFFAMDFAKSQAKLAGATAQTHDVPLLLLGLSRVRESGATQVVSGALRVHAEHANAEVRGQALLALLRIDVSNAPRYLMSFLTDRSSKVRHAGLNALRKTSVEFERQWAESLCEQTMERSQKHDAALYRALLQIMRHSGAWEQLAFALRFETMEPPRADWRGRSHGFLSEWFARNISLSVAPNAALRDLIEVRATTRCVATVCEPIMQRLSDCTLAKTVN